MLLPSVADYQVTPNKCRMANGALGLKCKTIRYLSAVQKTEGERESVTSCVCVKNDLLPGNHVLLRVGGCPPGPEEEGSS